jgi:hypothetical protein
LAKYKYSGRLTDLGVENLSGRMLKLSVRPKQAVMGPDGPVSSARVPVTFTNTSTGAFEFDAIASADLTPPVPYILEVGFFDVAVDDAQFRGHDQWTFTAKPGGGNVATMSDAPATRLVIGPPWPPSPLRGAYFDETTADLGFYDGEEG